MSYEPNNNLEIQTSGQADWETGLNANFQIIDRGFHGSFTAGTNIGSGEAFIADSNGIAQLYDASSIDNLPPTGVSYKNVNSGEQTNFLLRGIIDGYSSLSPGNPVYVDQASPGLLTSTPTIVGSDYNMRNVVGLALDNTHVYINPVPFVSFRDLIDVTHSYSGQAGKGVIVNSAEDGLYFGTVASSSGGGGGGGTFIGARPTVVQAVAAANNTGSVVFSANPTVGNVLVALGTHWTNNPLAATGWSGFDIANGASHDGLMGAMKVVTALDIASMTPFSGITAGANIAVFEVQGAMPIIPLTRYGFKEVTSISVTQYAACGIDNSLIVGMSAIGLSSTDLASISNVTIDQTSSGATTSGGPREVTAFHTNADSGTNLSITATYSASVEQYGMNVVLAPVYYASNSSAAALETLFTSNPTAPTTSAVSLNIASTNAGSMWDTTRGFIFAMEGKGATDNNGLVSLTPPNTTNWTLKALVVPGLIPRTYVAFGSYVKNTASGAYTAFAISNQQYRQMRWTGLNSYSNDINRAITVPTGQMWIKHIYDSGFNRMYLSRDDELYTLIDSYAATNVASVNECGLFVGLNQNALPQVGAEGLHVMALSVLSGSL